MNKNIKIILLSVLLFSVVLIGIDKVYEAVSKDIQVNQKNAKRQAESSSREQPVKESSSKNELTSVSSTEKEKPSNEKRVALTFDDGPNPKTTPEVLKTLDEYQVKATFFLLGTNVKSNPDIVKEIKKANHEIASHTNAHSDLTTLTPEQVKADIDKSDQAIKEITGEKPAYIRPPYGAVNKKVAEIIKRPLIQWSVDSNDWSLKNKEKIAERVKLTVYPGSIILLHDIQEQSTKALPDILRFLKAENYELVTISELLNSPKEILNYYGGKDNRPVK